MTVSFLRGIEIDGDVARVPLTRGRVAIIDKSDAYLVASSNWSAMKTGRDKFYAKRNRLVGDGPGPKAVLMHRIILSPPDGMVIDHINGDSLDNRRENLRIARQADNCRNSKMRSDNTSGLKGVFWDKYTGRWMAAIGYQGKFHNLGRFDAPEDAKAAYDEAASNMFGEFARLA